LDIGLLEDEKLRAFNAAPHPTILFKRSNERFVAVQLSNALMRLVPSWYADLGSISLYYASRTLRSSGAAGYPSMTIMSSGR
jgi:hypothetical protein